MLKLYPLESAIFDFWFIQKADILKGQPWNIAAKFVFNGIIGFREE